jgi:hypothetical protein
MGKEVISFPLPPLPGPAHTTGADDLLAALESDPLRGLSDDKVVELQSKYGPNRIKPPAKPNVRPPSLPPFFSPSLGLHTRARFERQDRYSNGFPCHTSPSCFLGPPLPPSTRPNPLVFVQTDWACLSSLALRFVRIEPFSLGNSSVVKSPTPCASSSSRRVRIRS